MEDKDGPGAPVPDGPVGGKYFKSYLKNWPFAPVPSKIGPFLAKWFGIPPTNVKRSWLESKDRRIVLSF